MGGEDSGTALLPARMLAPRLAVLLIEYVTELYRRQDRRNDIPRGMGPQEKLTAWTVAAFPYRCLVSECEPGAERIVKHACRGGKRMTCIRMSVVAIALAATVGVPYGAEAMRARTHEAIGFQLFESPQVNPLALSADGSELYVAHTTAGNVIVIPTSLNFATFTIPVGVDPVTLAVRPGANELWVSNHVSDTVSIIDINPASATRYRVIDTIQALDANGATTFDEPSGIAFTTSGAKAYVALSSRNQVAVINAATRAITGRLNIRAQEPRALAVRNVGGTDLLYVAAFESGNQSELSACPQFANPFTPSGSAPQCTLSLLSILQFATNPNLPGATKNIVIDPQVPDRDLFLFNTATDAEITTGGAPVSGMGTLLYGIAVNAAGRAYVAQTDALNTVNGIEGQNLVNLANRMFTNEIGAVTCTGAGCGAVTIKDLETAQTQAEAFATPQGIALSSDDATLVVTAAGSSRVKTLDAATLAVQATLDLGATGQAIPRGVVVRTAGGVKTAYVLNSLSNTVSVVAIANGPTPAAGTMTKTTDVLLFGDPTPQEVRRGRIAFHSGFASSSGTFSCGSCHPDGNTDQLLWRIGGACFFGACSQDDEPRSTMPVRGLKNTLPLHWDGTLGDPFGGRDGSIGSNSPPASNPADCDAGGPDGDHDCFRNLVNGSLNGVMCNQSGGCANGPSGLAGMLTTQEREDMAFYLASVSYPPARARRLDDTISRPGDAIPTPIPNVDGTPSTTNANALTGFQDFFTNQGGAAAQPDTCADSDAGCHELPLGAATDSSTLQAFDAPTMRGLTDRFLQFSLGPTNPEEVLVAANAGGTVPVVGTVSALEAPIQWTPSQGHREITTFGAAFLIFQPVYGSRPLNLWQMFEEASTGFSGSQARQVQLNSRTAAAGAAFTATQTQMIAVELGDERGLTNLQVNGVRNTGGGFQPLSLAYISSTDTYNDVNDVLQLTRAQMLAEAQAGNLIATLTAQLRSNWGTALGPQPLLDILGTGSNSVTGDPPIPVVASGDAGNPPPLTLLATDVRSNAALFVDGAPASGTLTCSAGVAGAFCVNGNVSIDLNQSLGLGLHLLQVQNEFGPLSPELPFCVGTATNCN